MRLFPSILSADFTRLGEQLREAEQAGADGFHIDVMDGLFVPNLSFGPGVVEACRRATALPLDVHLMIERPERFLEAFAAAGATRLTVHVEATVHIHRVLGRIRELGCESALALNPGTPLDALRPVLPEVDGVLVMSVNPGFGGQEFIEGSLNRLRILRGWCNAEGLKYDIAVDGGITAETGNRAAKAGASTLIAGSAVYRGQVPDNIARLRAFL